jgi:hypothetical protein
MKFLLVAAMLSIVQVIFQGYAIQTGFKAGASVEQIDKASKVLGDFPITIATTLSFLVFLAWEIFARK